MNVHYSYVMIMSHSLLLCCTVYVFSILDCIDCMLLYTNAVIQLSGYLSRILLNLLTSQVVTITYVYCIQLHRRMGCY